jgi:hypothetical protein
MAISSFGAHGAVFLGKENDCTEKYKRHNDNYFGLAEYWTHHQVQGAVKKGTRRSVASVKRSAKALANVRTCLCDFHQLWLLLATAILTFIFL